MPELPEVETIRKQLETGLKGKIIKSVKVLSYKQFPQKPGSVIGRKIISVERRAKLLILRLSGGSNLVIHLKLNGQLIWAPGARCGLFKLKGNIATIGYSLPSKSTRVILEIGKGRLFFNEMRKFGWIRLMTDATLKKELSRYGVEPLSKDFTVTSLGDICRRTSRAIKIVLLDQEKIAGIGNIYANESLYLSRINPKMPAHNLNKKQVVLLRQNIIKVLKLGLKYGGASDEYYFHPDLTTGSYQKHFLVYGRQGQKCKRCGATVRGISLSGRGTFYCPECQK